MNYAEQRAERLTAEAVEALTPEERKKLKAAGAARKAKLEGGKRDLPFRLWAGRRGHRAT